MTVVSFTAIDRMRGWSGSSENSAVQGRFEPSDHWTVTTVLLLWTRTGPGTPSVASNGTWAAEHASMIEASNTKRIGFQDRTRASITKPQVAAFRTWR